MSIGGYEILVILLVVLLLFGPKRIPELARALGKASHEFKKAKASLLREGEELVNEAEHASAEDTDSEGSAAPNATDETKRK